MPSKQPLFYITVEVTPNVNFHEMDPHDQEEPFLSEGGKMHYLARAKNQEDADEYALDAFHCAVPIHNLDDFVISTGLNQVSNHEQLKILADYPFAQDMGDNRALLVMKE